MSKSKGNTLDPIDLIDGISLGGCGQIHSGSSAWRAQGEGREYVRRTTRRGFLPLAPTPCVSPSLRWRASRTLSISISAAARVTATSATSCGTHPLRADEYRGQGLRAGRKGPVELSAWDRWIVSALQRTEGEVEAGFAEYRFDKSLARFTASFWDEYCDWYVELAKDQLARGKRGTATRHAPDPGAGIGDGLHLRTRYSFITRNCGKGVAPLAGKSGETIMRAPISKSQPERIDQAASKKSGRQKTWSRRQESSQREQAPAAGRVPAYMTGNPAKTACRVRRWWRHVRDARCE